MKKTYDWLFSHSTVDKDREVNRLTDIRQTDLKSAYDDMIRDYADPEVVDD